MNKTAPSQETTKRTERYAAAGVGLLFFCIYVLSASHTVILDYDDSAELQTIAAVGGVPHQPYPLWCVVAKAFALIPIGEPAFRATLLSIVFATLTLPIVFVLLFRRTRSLLISLGATGSLGFSFTFWQNAVVADIYAGNGLLFAVAAWTAIRFYREPSSLRWLLFVLVLGFLVCHHTTNVAVLPAAGLLLLWTRKQFSRRTTIRLAATSVFVFLLPFTLYLYTYEVDRQPRPINWLDDYGQYLHAHRGGDPEDFESFLGRMRFQMFSTRSIPHYSPLEWLRSMGEWCRLTARWEFPYLGAVLAFLGFLGLWMRGRRAALLATTVTIPYVLISIFIWGGAGMQRFSTPGYVLFALYVAEGLVLVSVTAERLRLKPTPIVIVLAILLMAIPVRKYSANTSEDNGRLVKFCNLRASNDRGKLLGEKMTRLLTPNSMVFCRWPHKNVLLYYKHVKGEFADVDIQYKLPRAEYMLDLIRRKRPTVVYFDFSPTDLGFAVEEVIPVIQGVDLYKVVPSGAK